ncbi:hypothetical protein SNEBB_002646 [Seison nebaliae]|nr:hypothetical protein SNEBB_002646 [Seison nebaliae]
MDSITPSNCPGPKSSNAGNEEPCKGCPNAKLCQSGEIEVDPNIRIIGDKLKGSVKNVVLILSGKGGVGKSSVAASLAVRLSEEYEKKVALLDIDICGPSQPKIFGCEDESVHTSNSGWSPVTVSDNLLLMSIGFLLPSKDDAVIWRGPKKNMLIKQFLLNVDWLENEEEEKIDYLIIDTPPGTSDEHLSIITYLKEMNNVTSILVTTPQQLSLIDVRKEISFCKTTSLHSLGLVVNMASFQCEHCNGENCYFTPNSGSVHEMCTERKIDLVTTIPMRRSLMIFCDEGKLLEKFKSIDQSFIEGIDGICVKIFNYFK